MSSTTINKATVEAFEITPTMNDWGGITITSAGDLIVPMRNGRFIVEGYHASTLRGRLTVIGHAANNCDPEEVAGLVVALNTVYGYIDYDADDGQESARIEAMRKRASRMWLSLAMMEMTREQLHDVLYLVVEEADGTRVVMETADRIANAGNEEVSK